MEDHKIEKIIEHMTKPLRFTPLSPNLIALRKESSAECINLNQRSANEHKSVSFQFSNHIYQLGSPFQRLIASSAHKSILDLLSAYGSVLYSSLPPLNFHSNPRPTVSTGNPVIENDSNLEKEASVPTSNSSSIATSVFNQTPLSNEILAKSTPNVRNCVQNHDSSEHMQDARESSDPPTTKMMETNLHINSELHEVAFSSDESEWEIADLEDFMIDSHPTNSISNQETNPIDMHGNTELTSNSLKNLALDTQILHAQPKEQQRNTSALSDINEEEIKKKSIALLKAIKPRPETVLLDCPPQLKKSNSHKSACSKNIALTNAITRDHTDPENNTNATDSTLLSQSNHTHPVTCSLQEKATSSFVSDNQPRSLKQPSASLKSNVNQNLIEQFPSQAFLSRLSGISYAEHVFWVAMQVRSRELTPYQSSILKRLYPRVVEEQNVFNIAVKEECLRQRHRYTSIHPQVLDLVMSHLETKVSMIFASYPQKYKILRVFSLSSLPHKSSQPEAPVLTYQKTVFQCGRIPLSSNILFQNDNFRPIELDVSTLIEAIRRVQDPKSHESLTQSNDSFPLIPLPGQTITDEKMDTLKQSCSDLASNHQNCISSDEAVTNDCSSSKDGNDSFPPNPVKLSYIRPVLPSVSCDPLAHKLGLEVEADVIMSSSALLALIDNHAPKFPTEWKIPVVVKTENVNSRTKKMIYIDKPFPNTNITPRECNILFMKHALAALSLHPELVQSNTKSPSLDAIPKSMYCFTSDSEWWKNMWDEVPTSFLQRPSGSADQSSETKTMEECFDTCPEGANLVYNLWKLGDLNLLLRCRIHAFEISGSHDISQVVHRAKMDYVPELGWETEFLSETLRSWIHAWIRSSKQSFARVFPNEKGGILLEYQQRKLIDIIKDSQKQLTLSQFAMLKSLTQQLQELSEGTYILHHKSGSTSVDVYQESHSSFSASLDSDKRNALQADLELDLCQILRAKPVVENAESYIPPVIQPLNDMCIPGVFPPVVRHYCSFFANHMTCPIPNCPLVHVAAPREGTLDTFYYCPMNSPVRNIATSSQIPKEFPFCIYYISGRCRAKKCSKPHFSCDEVLEKMAMHILNINTDTQPRMRKRKRKKSGQKRKKAKKTDSRKQVNTEDRLQDDVDEST